MTGFGILFPLELQRIYFCYLHIMFTFPLNFLNNVHTSISMFYLFIHLAFKPFRLEVDERSDTKQSRADVIVIHDAVVSHQKISPRRKLFLPRELFCSNRMTAVGCTRDVNKNF